MSELSERKKAAAARIEKDRTYDTLGRPSGHFPPTKAELKALEEYRQRLEKKKKNPRNEWKETATIVNKNDLRSFINLTLRKVRDASMLPLGDGVESRDFIYIHTPEGVLQEPKNRFQGEVGYISDYLFPNKLIPELKNMLRKG